MNVTFSIATPSGVQVLGRTIGPRVQFSAAAFRLGYAAMQVKRMVLAQADYLAKEPAAVSVLCDYGIVVEKC